MELAVRMYEVINLHECDFHELSHETKTKLGMEETYMRLSDRIAKKAGRHIDNSREFLNILTEPILLLISSIQYKLSYVRGKQFFLLSLFISI